MTKKIKKYKYFIVITGLALFFRLYNIEKYFAFAHDQDLYSWIAKDIINRDPLRLVGQITSVDGVFIGPFYYYLMALFYLLFRMNPLSAIIPTVGIGIVTVFSFYWVLKEFYGKKVALTAAFIYAVSYGAANFDRWSVPTQPTILWSIWFFYVVLMSLKGDKKIIPLYGLLIGLTWHIHIALAPILILPPIAWIWGKNSVKRIDRKVLFWFIASLLLTTLPFWLFEIKTDFSQIKSVLAASQRNIGEASGFYRLEKTMDLSAKEILCMIMGGLGRIDYRLVWIISAVTVAYLTIKGNIKKKEAGLITLWVFLVLIAQFMSKRGISEYYFANLTPLFVIFLAMVLTRVIATKKIVGLILVTAYFVINLNWSLTRTDWGGSYYYRNKLMDYIKEDYTKKNYPCASVNYIADFGSGVGFRYLFWYKGIQLVKAFPGVPAYNIVVPWAKSGDEVDVVYGDFGVILPEEREYAFDLDCHSKEMDPDPLLGFTD
ncbi:MAG: ArnT family glycosyltransferase [Patescibacteria group bacterium]|jgi:4-amino-4-deoxy-L-arabinose transferase-like glycosyltransferase